MANLDFMDRAVALSLEKMKRGLGGPFGAVIVKDGQIIAEGFNQVTSTNDPTAHAEVIAIREACQKLGSFQLSGCEIYATSEPCPMCMAAIYWSRLDKVYFCNSIEEASEHGFDDSFIRTELGQPNEMKKIPMVKVDHPEALLAFKEWANKEDKIEY